MDAINAALTSNLQSLQSAISMATMNMAMNSSASSAAALVETISEVPPPSSHIIDTLA